MSFFLQSCGGGNSGTTVPVTSDLTPDEFIFNPIVDVSLNVVTLSNVITVSGIDAAAPISIIGGEYAIDGNSFTDINGTILNGQSVQVRQTSSNSTASTTDVTLSIGGMSAKFSVTTVNSIFRVTPANLDLGDISEGTSSTFTVKLRSRPTGDVVLSVASNLVDQATVDKTSLTFTALDTGGVNSWEDPQTVTVNGVDDKKVDPDTLVKINVKVSASTSPGYPVNANTAITANVVNIHSSVPGVYIFPSKSNVALNTPITSIKQTIIGTNVAVPLTLGSNPGDKYSINGGSFLAEDSAKTVTVINGDTIQLQQLSSSLFSDPKTVTVTIGGVSSSFKTTTLAKDITPIPFPISAIIDAELGVTVSSAVITVSGVNTNTPISVSAGAGNSFTINGLANKTTVVNGDKVIVQLTSATTLNTPKSVTLTIGTEKATFTVTTILALPKIVVSPASPTTLNLTESGATTPVTAGSFSVKLASKPTGSVTINASSLNSSIVMVNPSFAPITFDATNWSSNKTIPITSVDDNIAGGTRTASIKVTASAIGTNYANLTTQGDVAVADDDVAGVIITPVNLVNIIEGTTKTFTVKLQSEPLENVVLDLTVTNATGLTNRAAVDKVTLTFTKATRAGNAIVPSNWNISQTVTVTAVDDKVAAGNEPVNINLKVNTIDSTGYNSATQNKTIIANVIDIQTAETKDFLQFLNKSAPRNNQLTGNRLQAQLNKPLAQQNTLLNGVVLPAQQVADAGAAYYTAIDPNNKRLTLADFKTFNNLNDNLDSNGLANVAVYVNDADLGFGRRMYVSVNTDPVTKRTLSAASCVENYAPYIQDPKFPNDSTKLIPDVNATPQQKVDKATAGIHTGDKNGGFIASVCMEYSGSPGTSTVSASALKGRKFVKFFSYGAPLTGSSLLDGRITEADLDGNGKKTQPGVCNVCHGGQSNSLKADGSYPLLGDTGAQFLPWDLDTFIFTGNTLPAGDPGNLIPVGYQEIFNRFNQAVLDTYPKVQTFRVMQANAKTPLLSVAPGLSGSSFISVPTVAKSPLEGIPEITSLMVSVDSDFNGTGPGITNIQGELVSLTLINPDRILGNTAGRTGKYVGFGFGSPGSPSKIFAAKDLYWGDSTPYGRTPLLPNPYDSTSTNPPTNIISGISHPQDDRGFVRRGECVAGALPRDYGCRSAAGSTPTAGIGKWELLVKNNSTTTTTKLNSWSLHFNGIPEKIYLPAPVELIRGWYGGLDPTTGRLNPNATFIGSFIPAGWLDVNNSGAKITDSNGKIITSSETLYKNVIAPSCRACHVQRGSIVGNDIDFSSYAKFIKYKDKIKTLVFDRGLMPLAKRTYKNRFWKFGSGQPEELAIHILPSGSPVIKPGRNIANAGLERIGDYAIQWTGVNTVVNLDGGNSLFNNGKYLWKVTTSASVSVPVTGANTATPSFVAKAEDIYTVTLDTSSSGNSQVGSSTRSIIKVQLLATAAPAIVYSKDIIRILDSTTGVETGVMKTCSGPFCHGQHSVEPTQRRYKFIFAERHITGQAFPTARINEAYRLLKDRINTFLPDESLTIQKALGTDIHPGTRRRYVTTPQSIWNSTNVDYINFKRWVLEGAKNDLVP